MNHWNEMMGNGIWRYHTHRLRQWGPDRPTSAQQNATLRWKYPFVLRGKGALSPALRYLWSCSLFSVSVPLFLLSIACQGNFQRCTHPVKSELVHNFILRTCWEMVSSEDGVKCNEMTQRSIFINSELNKQYETLYIVLLLMQVELEWTLFPPSFEFLNILTKEFFTDSLEMATFISSLFIICCIFFGRWLRWMYERRDFIRNIVHDRARSEYKSWCRWSIKWDQNENMREPLLDSTYAG